MGARVRAVLAGAAILLASAGFASGAVADPLPFSISSAPEPRLGASAPVAPIAPGFLGASIDYCQITIYMHGHNASVVLSNLLRALSPDYTLLRIGGEGPEEPCPHHKHHPVAPEIHAIHRLLSTLPAQVMLGIDLMRHSPPKARHDVVELLHELDPHPPYRRVAAFELGNEPDLLRRYGPSVPGPQSGPFFSRYLRDFSRWAAIARKAAHDRHVAVAGPSLGRLGMPWFRDLPGNFPRFVHGPAHPKYLTFHGYPLQGGGRCPGTLCPSMPNLLLNSSSAGLAAQLTPYPGNVPAGRELRVDEMNSITGGGRSGISNAFTAALWALDGAFEMARVGVHALNFHTFSTANYALFSLTAAHGWLVHPEYYGLLMFDRAAPAGSQMLTVSPSQPAEGAPNVKVWATRGADHRTRVLIINKDLSDHQLTLSGNGLPSHGSAFLEPLRAPPYGGGPKCPTGYRPTGLCASSGVTLAGRTFGPAVQHHPSGDQTSTGLLAAPSTSCSAPLPASCVLPINAAGTSVLVPAASALLLITI